MADWYYGISKGEDTYESVSQATDPGDQFVIKVKVQPGVDRSDLLVALEKLQDFILRTPWPPVTPSP